MKRRRRQTRSQTPNARSAPLQEAIATGLVYVGNPKHKEPWIGGRRGSLCPKDITIEQAQALLNRSILYGKKRYAVDGQGRPFCAQASELKHGRWHGYPVKWREVPVEVQKSLKQKNLVSTKQFKRYW